MAALPDGDIAEVVVDSCRNAWGRFYTAGIKSWSAWWPISSGAQAAAITAYTDGDEPTGLIRIAAWKQHQNRQSARARRFQKAPGPSTGSAPLGSVPRTCNTAAPSTTRRNGGTALAQGELAD